MPVRSHSRKEQILVHSLRGTVHGGGTGLVMGAGYIASTDKEQREMQADA